MAKLIASLFVALITVACLIATLMGGQYLSAYGPAWILSDPASVAKGVPHLGMGTSMSLLILLVTEFLVGCVIMSEINKS